MPNQRWQTKSNPRMKGLYGVATIRPGKTAIKVLLEATETRPEQMFEFALDKAPADIRAGKWFVSIAGDGSQLYSFAPVQGAFTCKFLKLACPEGQLPAPKHYTMTFKDDKGHEGISEYDAFTALLEIVDGKDAGLVIPYFLRYYFGEVDGNVAFIKPKSKYTQQLTDFLDATGTFEKGAMAFSENILPALEARLKTANCKVMVIIKQGRVDAISHLETD